MDKFTCIVKIIVNPQLEQNINLTVSVPKKTAKLKIILQNENDINQMINDTKKIFDGKFNFNLIFNWKATPKSIRENKFIQNELQKIFENSDNLNEIVKLANIVRKHILMYGSAPNLKLYSNEKCKIKIYNYIKSLLGIPDLTIEDSMKIAKYLID